jgi:hypothetical protein
MSEKMLVTQALDERDLLVKKINEKIVKAIFVDILRLHPKTSSLATTYIGTMAMQ